jgi:hypothetical protein
VGKKYVNKKDLSQKPENLHHRPKQEVGFEAHLPDQGVTPLQE